MARRFAKVGSLRAPDCKYQKSYDRREISDFILFHLNVTYYFQKTQLKVPPLFRFSKN